MDISVYYRNLRTLNLAAWPKIGIVITISRASYIADYSVIPDLTSCFIAGYIGASS
jgi:hypothetical protein